MLPIASYEFGDALLTVLAIFFFIVWVWILISVIGDLFRDHELSGWAKGVWVIALVLIPFMAVLVYLIFRGPGMRDRAIKEQADVQKHFDDYVRQTASSGSVADELHKLSDLKDKGAISDTEFDAQKAKLLA